MIVTASIYHDYLFKPNSYESWDFARTLGNVTIPKDDGFTLSVYQRIPFLAVQGQSYFSLPVVAEDTRIFQTKSHFLYSLGGAINLNKMAPASMQGGFKLPSGYSIKTLVTGAQCNHIPQMFAVDSNTGLLVTAINGWYDFKAGIFEGQLLFSSLDDLP